jgi:diguanylate cyclase (GGDEF)-like protein
VLGSLKQQAPRLTPPVSASDTGLAQDTNQPEPVNRFIKTNLKGREVTYQAIYFLAVASVGIPLFIRVLLTRPLPEPKTTALLVTLGLVSYHLPVVLPSRVHILPGFPLVMGALFSHGIAAAALVIIPSFLLHFFTRKHGLCNCLFNAGQFTICLYTADYVGRLAGWNPGIPASSPDLIPVILMIVVYDAANILFVTGSRAIETREPVAESFVKMFYDDRKAVLAQRTFLAVVAMLLSSHMGNIAFIIVFIGVLSLRLQNRFQKELVEKTEEAETDPLTKTHNLRYLEKWMDTDFKALVESKKHCSVIFLDVDGLKAVNDAYGHSAGDQLLIHVAGIIADNTRSKDRIARYGGDEFIVLCPGTNLTQATSIAKRIREAASKKPFAYNEVTIEFGISIGVAAWPEHGETGTDIIRMADKAMYLAKTKGGNTVHTASKL